MILIKLDSIPQYWQVMNNSAMRKVWDSGWTNQYSSIYDSTIQWNGKHRMRTQMVARELINPLRDLSNVTSRSYKCQVLAPLAF